MLRDVRDRRRRGQQAVSRREHPPQSAALRDRRAVRDEDATRRSRRGASTLGLYHSHTKSAAYPVPDRHQLRGAVARRDLADRVARRSATPRPAGVPDQRPRRRRGRARRSTRPCPSRSHVRAARSAIRWRSGSAPSAACRSPTRARWTPSSRRPRSRRALARSSRSTRAATCGAWPRAASSPRPSSSRCCCSRRASRAPCAARPGFDVPDMLAAGPRDVLVPESGVEAARDVLLQSDIEVTQAPHVARGTQRPRARHVAGLACWRRPASQRC